jgi:hypothetical protein
MGSTWIRRKNGMTRIAFSDGDDDGLASQPRARRAATPRHAVVWLPSRRRDILNGIGHPSEDAMPCRFWTIFIRR